MKKIKLIPVPIIFLIQIVGFAENVTQSDQDIVLLQHLIEIDSTKLESENKVFVRETLTFRNKGTNNFSGELRTWLPDRVSEIRIAKVEMKVDGSIQPLQAIQNGNIISWQDFIKTNESLPSLYVIEYVVSEYNGRISYSKKLIYPALITKNPSALC